MRSNVQIANILFVGTATPFTRRDDVNAMVILATCCSVGSFGWLMFVVCCH